MNDDRYYFAGDPATDSPRRHLERLLSEPAPRRKWPWVLGLLAGGGTWTFWRLFRHRRE